MGCRRSDLQEAFFVPGTHAFRVFGYGTADSLEAVLAPGYFGAASDLLQPGDLIYLRAQAAAVDPAPAAATCAVHLALLMVRSGKRGSPAIRRVQDFGRSDEPDAPRPSPLALPAAVATPAPPPKRGRGRPPGSRSKNRAAVGNDLLN